MKTSMPVTHRRHKRSGVLVAVLFIIAAATACTSSTHAKATSSGSTPVGLWHVTYGAPAIVAIAESGPNRLIMTAHSAVTVVDARCQLVPGTTLATLTGSTSPYRGKHGLWSTADCAFASWTPMTLRVNGDTAVAQMSDGEHFTMTRASPSARAPVRANRSVLWLWIVAAIVVLGLALGYVALRRRRRT